MSKYIFECVLRTLIVLCAFSIFPMVFMADWGGLIVVLISMFAVMWCYEQTLVHIPYTYPNRDPWEL